MKQGLADGTYQAGLLGQQNLAGLQQAVSSFLIPGTILRSCEGVRRLSPSRLAVERPDALAHGAIRSTKS